MKVKKRVGMIIMLLYSAGLLIFSLSSIFRDNLSGFLLGFREGVSLVLILAGCVYIVWGWVHKKNPFKY